MQMLIIVIVLMLTGQFCIAQSGNTFPGYVVTHKNDTV